MTELSEEPAGPAPADPAIAARARSTLLQMGGRLAFPLPDALLALVFAFAATLEFLTPEQLARVPFWLGNLRQELFLVIMLEGGFLLAQATLVDIASRLKKRPPVWAILPILAAVVVLAPGFGLDMIRMAWAQGSAVFVPMMLSLAERGTVLWRLPSRSAIEKIAARALIANRITTGLAVLGMVTIVMVASVVLKRDGAIGQDSASLIAAAIYFGVAAYDDARVRTRRFAERPTVLFRWDTMGGVDRLDPL
jgi:hypothetical protein